MIDEQAENPLAVSGHNRPPAEPTPFDLSKTEIDDLYGEAELWLDGAPIENQAQADAIAMIITKMRAAEKLADDRRSAENKPFDDGKAEVQARYNPLIGSTKSVKGKSVKVIEVCKAALDAFLKREEAKKRAAAEEARREADERQRIAQEAIRAADRANLAERERAEELVRQAKTAESLAKKAEADKPVARGGGRALSSRVAYKPVLIDAKLAARHAWTDWNEELCAFMLGMAEQAVAQKRPIPPGFELQEVRSVS